MFLHSLLIKIYDHHILAKKVNVVKIAVSTDYDPLTDAVQGIRVMKNKYQGKKQQKVYLTIYPLAVI